MSDENKAQHRKFMGQAIKLAQAASDQGEVPIGCLIVHQDRVIAKGYNLNEQLMDPTAHAEMQAITAASSYLNAKFLEDCTVYVTLEPCVMCAGALFLARPKMLVYGASDSKFGFSKFSNEILHPKTEQVGGIMVEESLTLLRQFFEERRGK